MVFLLFNISAVSIMGVGVSQTFDNQIAEPLRLDESFREQQLPIDTSTAPINDQESNVKTSKLSTAATVVDLKMWLTLDDYIGYYFFDTYELWESGVGENVEIWIQQDRSWLDGSTDLTNIDPEKVSYLVQEFENQVMPTDEEYFGTPDFHDGSQALLEAWGYVPEGYYQDQDGKRIVLVSNIRDDQYHTEFPYFIIGFYSPTYEAYFDRNIINLDAYAWDYLVGDDAARPNTYEATLAHEYQHLIHDDYNPEDDLFMNEGCSMFAEVLNDYPINWGDINRFLYTPDNSLTIWGDQGGHNILADYGSALLWTVYLSDHFGGSDLISHFVKTGIPGIEGLNAALDYFGYDEDFDDVFNTWRIANLIHSDQPGDGIYNYKTIDLNSEEAIQAFTYNVPGEEIPWTTGFSFGDTVNYDGFDLGISNVGPYGSDYIRFNDLEGLNKVYFDGDDTVIYGWQQTDYGWWSDNGNLMNTLLFGEAFVDPNEPTLSIDTWFDIEANWDFGFAQVSTDGGETWTSLENAYTTSDHADGAHPDVIANLPGLTGYSGGWVSMDFDLSAYAGENVLIGFRYVTDWYTTGTGWYIDGASVGGSELNLQVDAYPEADFDVTTVKVRTLPNGKSMYIVRQLETLDSTEQGNLLENQLGMDDLILVVSPTMDLGFTDYQFSISKH